MTKRIHYTAPSCEVVRLKAESMICTTSFGLYNGDAEQWSQGRDEGEWENSNSIWGDLEEEDE